MRGLIIQRRDGTLIFTSGGPRVAAVEDNLMNFTENPAGDDEVCSTYD